MPEKSYSKSSIRQACASTICHSQGLDATVVQFSVWRAQSSSFDQAFYSRFESLEHIAQMKETFVLKTRIFLTGCMRRKQCYVVQTRESETSNLNKLYTALQNYTHNICIFWNVRSFIAIYKRVLHKQIKLRNCYTRKADHTGPRGLIHEPSSLSRTLGSLVRIPLEAWISVCVYSVFVLFCV
jgi:hypothetical protein